MTISTKNNNGKVNNIVDLKSTAIADIDNLDKAYVASIKADNKADNKAKSNAKRKATREANKLAKLEDQKIADNKALITEDIDTSLSTAIAVNKVTLSYIGEHYSKTIESRVLTDRVIKQCFFCKTVDKYEITVKGYSIEHRLSNYPGMLGSVYVTDISNKDNQVLEPIGVLLQDGFKYYSDSRQVIHLDNYSNKNTVTKLASEIDSLFCIDNQYYKKQNKVNSDIAKDKKLSERKTELIKGTNEAVVINRKKHTPMF